MNLFYLKIGFIYLLKFKKKIFDFFFFHIKKIKF